MGVLFTKLVNLRVLRHSGAAQSRSINMLRLAFNLRKESHVCLAGRMVRIERSESGFVVSLVLTADFSIESKNANLRPIPVKMIEHARASKTVGMEPQHEWAVILAEGDGTRLKSLSRTVTALRLFFL